MNKNNENSLGGTHRKACYPFLPSVMFNHYFLDHGQALGFLKSTADTSIFQTQFLERLSLKRQLSPQCRQAIGHLLQGDRDADVVRVVCAGQLDPADACLGKERDGEWLRLTFELQE